MTTNQFMVGAVQKVENILSYERDFPATETVKLEQNYRSTSNILQAANAVIAKNSGRLGKNLWTDAGEGEAIALYSAFNEHDEARYIADRLISGKKMVVYVPNVPFFIALTPSLVY